MRHNSPREISKSRAMGTARAQQTEKRKNTDDEESTHWL